METGRTIEGVVGVEVRTRGSMTNGTPLFARTRYDIFPLILERIFLPGFRYARQDGASDILRMFCTLTLGFRTDLDPLRALHFIANQLFAL